MPFIDSKVSVSISPKQEAELVKRLGQAISIIPGKSESWILNIPADHVYIKYETVSNWGFNGSNF